MAGMSRYSLIAVLTAGAAVVLPAGCHGPGEFASSGPNPPAAPEGTISVYQLSGRLDLRVEQCSRGLATLSDRFNRVRIFSGDPGRICVNGRLVGEPVRVAPVGEMLFVPRELESRIRGSLRRPPDAEPKPGDLRKLPHAGARVVIDPGHGGRDPGAIGAGGILEKSVNLALAEQVARRLRRRGVDVHMTRSTDTFVSLADRADLANGLSPSLLASIHANSFKNDPTVRGFDVFVAKGASSDSVAAASAIITRLERHGILRHGPQPKRENFHVLVRAACPSVLIEAGYLSNRIDAAELRTSSYRRHVAAAIAAGICDHLAAR